MKLERAHWFVKVSIQWKVLHYLLIISCSILYGKAYIFLIILFLGRCSTIFCIYISFHFFFKNSLYILIVALLLAPQILTFQIFLFLDFCYHDNTWLAAGLTNYCLYSCVLKTSSLKFYLPTWVLCNIQSAKDRRYRLNIFQNLAGLRFYT